MLRTRLEASYAALYAEFFRSFSANSTEDSLAKCGE